MLLIILREGIVLASLGSAIGMLLAYVAGRAMQALLAGVGPADLVTFSTAAVLAILMTMSGSVLPALCALRIDPAIALRID